MVLNVELRRSSRIKRQTTPFIASTSKRVKIVSQSTATSVGIAMPHAIDNSIASPIGTSAPQAMDASTSITIQTSEGPPSTNPADSGDGNKKPLPFGSPPAWSEVDIYSINSFLVENRWSVLGSSATVWDNGVLSSLPGLGLFPWRYLLRFSGWFPIFGGSIHGWGNHYCSSVSLYSPVLVYFRWQS